MTSLVVSRRADADGLNHAFVSEKHSASREPGLDTLRAVAIVAVMLYHLRPFLPESIGVVGQFGWIGVDLFFILSGYLIGFQLFRPYAVGEQPRILNFYLRRLLRILPAYLVVIVLYAAWPAWREAPGFGPLWKFLTFTENLLFNPDFRAFSHVWSLCVEEHFYLVLPLLTLWIAPRSTFRRMSVLLSAVLIGGILMCAWAVIHADNFMHDIYYPTWMRLDGLLVGVGLAQLRVFRPGWWELVLQRGHLVLLAGLALVGVMIGLLQDDGYPGTEGLSAWATVLGFPILAVGLGMILMSSIARNGLLRRLPIPGARFVANLAFTLYLTHKAVAHLTRVYLPRLTARQDIRAALTYATSCLIAAAILHFCVERPFLRLRDLLDRRPNHSMEDILLSEPAL